MAIDPSGILLTGRVAVVTGGGAGIGLGIASGLAAFGAAVAAALDRTAAELGTVTVLVNNAGGTFSSPLQDTSENAWDALYKANLRHVLLCTQRVAGQMVDTGVGGSVISVTSIEGVRAAPGYAAYAAAKAGVINYTRTAAFELAPHGIRVNALAPDVIVTEGLMALSPAGPPAGIGDAIPMGRPGSDDEMAGAAVFLASDLASYITGQTLHVDGGTHAAGGWYRHPRTGAATLGPG
ncbi:SDR family NAD(P)-dependent oxidoreductase [Mycolicibacterium baixiangningiae]|uniref:SDR family NAD(P)-dependent oxidoreductase n=1 Tax=Mycolicibacterium baixiangningiae TaxID=2761578 RepID=UPI0018679FE9|nr:SDR family oxidoreductase [Mycolicibacterium baixiangningiae]